jgi:hypothetical protein
MRILPPRTLPPNTNVERRHEPATADGRYGYQAYRSCLRWDFAFSCAFCLLHEGDLADVGTEGLAIMGIEHFSPASRASEKINDYENCYYACRFCNRARSRAPLVDENGRRLLDPSSHVWGQHFVLSDDDRLVPVSGPDAEYTEQAYALNDLRKVRRRRIRRERMTEWLALIAQGPSRAKALIALSEKVPSIEDAQLLLDEAIALRRRVGLAIKEIQRYFAVPADADYPCACGLEDQCRLPTWLDSQTFELALDLSPIQE